MFADIDISGVANLIIDSDTATATNNRTVFVSSKTFLLQNTMLAVRFKQLLYQYDIQARTAILQRCMDWMENYHPTDEATLTWFRQAATMNSMDLLNAGNIWDQLYNVVCHQNSFREISKILFSDI